MKKLLTAVLFSSFVYSCTSTAAASNPKMSVIEAVHDDSTVLVDVRIPQEYEKETAADAINIPLAELENRTDELKGKKVVVFCNRGFQADDAYKILQKAGIEVYDGSTVQNVQAILNLK